VGEAGDWGQEKKDGKLPLNRRHEYRKKKITKGKNTG